MIDAKKFFINDFIQYRTHWNSRLFKVISVVLFFTFVFFITRALYSIAVLGEDYNSIWAVYLVSYALLIIFPAFYYVLSVLYKKSLHSAFFRYLNFFFSLMVLLVFIVVSLFDYDYRGDAYSFSIAVIGLGVVYQEHFVLKVMLNLVLTGLLIVAIALFSHHHVGYAMTLFKLMLYSVIGIILAYYIDSSLYKTFLVEKSMREKNSKIEQDNYVMQRDMHYAITTQRALIPQEPPVIRGWDIGFYSRPVAGVSGDFHDFYTNNRRLEGVALFDVSGHGISSALITIHAKSIAFRHFSALASKGLPTVFESLNADLIRELGESFMYLTGIILNFTVTGVEYLNAGHSDIIHRCGKTGKAKRIVADEELVRNPILGIDLGFHDWFSIKFKVRRGDFLFLCTDGLHEIQGTHSQDAASINRFIAEHIESLPLSTTAKEYQEYIISNVQKQAGNDFVDDVTLIVLKKI